MRELLQHWGAVQSLFTRDGVLNAIPNQNGGLNVDPLSDYHRRGLIAMTTVALLSTVTTFAMLMFITVRLIFWRRYSKQYLGYNQYVILIYSLLIADFQQSLAFLLNAVWVASNEITSPSPVCFLQGIWIQIGGPGSGLFVLAIAFHTFMQVTLGRTIRYKSFVISILGIWGFMVVMALIPIMAYGKNPFAPTGAWCWLNEDYAAARLWTHYLWIFVAEFGTTILYGAMHFQLRRQIAASAILDNRHIESLDRLRRVVNYMAIYPIAYLFLSLPLATERIASAHGLTPTVTHFCVAGVMISSAGFVDVILYAVTRRNFLISSEQSEVRSELNPFHHYDYRSNHVTKVTVDAERDRDGVFGLDVSGLRLHGHSKCNGNLRSCDDRNGSTDTIIGKTQDRDSVKLSDFNRGFQKTTTIQITHEPAYRPGSMLSDSAHFRASSPSSSSEGGDHIHKSKSQGGAERIQRPKPVRIKGGGS